MTVTLGGVSHKHCLLPLFHFCLIGDILKKKNTEMFIEYSSKFQMTFVQIGEFDWLSGRQKGLIFVKMFKNLLLRNHIGDEA